MPSSTILSDNGVSSGSAGLKSTAGNDGSLLIQTSTAAGAATTAITISNTQVVTYANQPIYTGGQINGVAYLGASKNLITDPTKLSFDGTNLGVGTSTFATGSKFAVQTASGKFDVASYGGSSIQIQSTASFGYTVPSTSYDHIWFQGTTELMRVTGGGNLLVGATGTGYKFNVVAGASYCASLACNSGNVPLTCAITSGSGSQTYAYFYNGATLTGTITTTGTNTAYNSISDYRLKENIAPMMGALNIVKQLNPVTYKWKTDGTDGQGFIAHELQAVVPECVTGEKDAVDENGNPKYQAIDTSFLVATLTAAIQEQQAIIQTLTSRLEALEAK